jgi:hypothetical protein
MALNQFNARDTGNVEMTGPETKELETNAQPIREMKKSIQSAGQPQPKKRKQGALEGF